MKPDVDINSGHVTPPGHVAALYQDELYDMTVARAGVARLQSFGVIFGHNRVVLYIEPDTQSQRVESNTARTHLSINGEPLPWTEWAAEFRERLPDAIRALVEAVGAESASSDHRQSIRERLKQFLDLFRLPRYRPTRDAAENIDPESLVAGGNPRRGGGGQRGNGSGSSGSSGGRAGSIYGLFLAAEGTPGGEVAVKGEPDRKWVTVPNGGRTPGDMEDRAAKYIAQQNLLLINGDFRVFTNMEKYWTEKYQHAPGSAAVVSEIVREWFEQQLVEAIIGAEALRDSREWTMSDLEQLWSPEALTAVVIPRYHVNLAIRRALGARLGSLKDRVA